MLFTVGDKSFNRIRKLDYNRFVYPKARGEADKIRQFGSVFLMYIPRGGASYAHLLSEETGLPFWPFNPNVIRDLVEGFGPLKIQIVDDCIGGGTTYNGIRLAMPRLADWKLSVVWVDVDYFKNNDIDYFYMMATLPKQYIAGWWESKAEIINCATRSKPREVSRLLPSSLTEKMYIFNEGRQAIMIYLLL